MTSHVVEQLVMELELELGKFRSQSSEAERINNKLKDSLKETESAGGKAADGQKRFGNETESARKKTDKKSKSLIAATKAAVGLFSAIASSTAIASLASGIAKVNDNLSFMQKRLNLSTREITLMANAASALGGDADSMTATMKSLNQGIQQMVIMGDATMLPFFNALGVGVMDSNGKMKGMNEILLEMADSLSKLDPQQAYAIASAMGIDEGTANALVQGRDAMQGMIDAQKTLYTSSQAELAASRELNKQRALLAAKWDGLKVMLGNALIPLMTKLTETAQGFVDYLMRNERGVQRVFEGISWVIGVATVAALGKAAIAAAGLLAPFAGVIAVVTALASAFLLLYDDYKVWADGGDSLFDWGTFDGWIKKVNVSVESLGRGFLKLLTGYEDLGEAVTALIDWLTLKGFIDENGLSIEGLGTGFKNLAKDIFNSVEILQVFADIIGKLLTGDFSGAWEAAKNIPKALASDILSIGGGAMKHVTGAIETGLGMNPDEEGTVTQWFNHNLNKSQEWINENFTPEVIGTPGRIVSDWAGRQVNSLSNWAGGKVDEAGNWVSDKVSAGADWIGDTAHAAGAPFRAAGDWAADKRRQAMAWAGLDTEQSINNAMQFSRGGDYAPTNKSVSNASSSEFQVTVSNINVQTSAQTLPAVTKEALGATLSAAGNSLNQLGSGL